MSALPAYVLSEPAFELLSERLSSMEIQMVCVHTWKLTRNGNEWGSTWTITDPEGREILADVRKELVPSTPGEELLLGILARRQYKPLEDRFRNVLQDVGARELVLNRDQ